MVRLERRRYIAFKVYGSLNRIDGRDVYEAFMSALLTLFGEYEASKTSAILIHYNEGGYGVVRCSNKALHIVKTALAAITRIKGNEAALHIIKVSGCLRVIRKEISRLQGSKHSSLKV